MEVEGGACGFIEVVFAGWDISDWRCRSKVCCCDCLVRGSMSCSDSESVEEVLGLSWEKEKGFVQWRWLGVVCCVVLRWKWVVLTYTGVVIQDCLNEMSSRFFTNGSSEYWSLEVDNCSVWESGMLFLTCEVTILGGPHMTWWCQYCRCPIYNYDVVLAIAWSNKSSEVPHSTVQGNENWWGVDNTVQSNESQWLQH